MATNYEGQPPRSSSLHHLRQAMSQRQLPENPNQSSSVVWETILRDASGLNGIRYRVTQQLTVWLNQLPESDTQHIPRIPHAHKARLPHKLEIPMAEVKLLVDRMIRKASQLTRNMH